MLASACSTFVAYHSHNGKQTEKQPRLEYIDTRKVCVEDSRPSQHTTESIYYTPWSYLFNVLDRYSIVVVSKVQKQCVSNAFQYVVLHPAAPSSSGDIPAIKQIAVAKIRKSLESYYLLDEKLKIN